MRFQLLFTIATIFSSVALGADERKTSSAVKASVIEMLKSIRAQNQEIMPPYIEKPGGGPPSPPNPDHAWLKEKAKAQFPKIREVYKKLEPELADDAKNWDIEMEEDIHPYQFCAAAFNLFREHAGLIKTILKYYSSFVDEIKEIQPDIASFQKQCEAFDKRIVQDLDPHTEDCEKTHKQLKGAKSLVRKYQKIGSKSAELR
ncbi:hypothetical protein V8C35DRAFT_298645 [Trichoderma chlorosporum]